MTAHGGQSSWHDLTRPAPAGAGDPARPGNAGQRVTSPPEATPASRRHTEPATIVDRGLRSHVVTNATLASVYVFLTVVFGSAAAVLDPPDVSPTLLAAATLAGSTAVAAVPLALAATAAAQTIRHRPAGRTETAAIWFTRVNLGAAAIVLLLTAVVKPSAVTFAVIHVVIAANGWVFLLNTRDAIRRHPRTGPQNVAPTRAGT